MGSILFRKNAEIDFRFKALKDPPGDKEVVLTGGRSDFSCKGVVRGNSQQDFLMAKGFIFQLGIQASVAEDREINPAVCEKTLLYGICFLQEIQADIGVYPAESGRISGIIQEFRMRGKATFSSPSFWERRSASSFSQSRVSSSTPEAYSI